MGLRSASFFVASLRLTHPLNRKEVNSEPPPHYSFTSLTPPNRKTGSAPLLNSSQANDLGAPLFANPAEPGFKNRTPSTI